MIVKNYLVNNKSRFLELLIQDLIKRNISYVVVDNFEVHFDKYIVRLFTKKEIYLYMKTSSIKSSLLDAPVDHETIDTLFPNYAEMSQKKSINLNPKLTRQNIKLQNKKTLQRIRLQTK